MRAKTIVAGIVAVAVILVALGGAWYLTHTRPPKYCQLSGRPIRPHMLTTVRIGGKTMYACCARCALTYEQQTGTPVTIVRVTDYLSGREIDAKKAYFADGSQVEPCCVPAAGREEGRTTYIRMFDRCFPSLIAFADQNDARAFVEQHGGTVTTLNELEKQAKSKIPGAKHD